MLTEWKLAHFSPSSDFCATSVLLAEDAWKWTDDEGVVHYSDVPVDGAEQVHLSEYSKKTGARISNATELTRPKRSLREFAYETLAVTSPAAEQTLWNIEGDLHGQLSVSPSLHAGHRIRLYFDGKPRTWPERASSSRKFIAARTTCRAEVIDATGRVLIRSDPNRFYVQQNSVR